MTRPPFSWAGPDASSGPETALPRASQLSLSRYAVLTVAGLVLTGCQLLLLPRLLSARQFGLVVLSISITQLLLQVGDLGFSRLCLDSTRPPEVQARLRAEGQSLTLVATAAVIAVLGGLWAIVPEDRPVLVALGLGGLAAAAVSGEKYRAAAREVAGDEVAAANHNFLWTNAPKLGLVVGVVALRSAVSVLVVSVVVGAVLCSPYWSSPRLALTALRRAGEWALPFVTIAASFLLTWMDTYFLTARMGVEGAAAYEAVYRILGVCTYAFLPWVSVVNSRLSVGAPRALRRPLLLALATGGLFLAASAALLAVAGSRLFPRLDLPLEVIPPLILFYLLTAVSYCVGSALYVRARFSAAASATAVGALVGLAAHAVFTLRGGPSTAAWVATAAMAVTVAILSAAYVRTAVRGPAGG